MKTLAEIRAHLVAGQFEFSRHALRRAVERNIIITLYEPDPAKWYNYVERR